MNTYMCISVSIMGNFHRACNFYKNKEILRPKIVLDSASTRYSLQTKLDRQYALIFILQQAIYLCEVYVRISAEVSQILVS